MKKNSLFFLIVMLLGCSQQREVQLPHTTLNEITEVHDVSPVYLFYDEANDTVILNRKNLISTTNWLVNIDKRLTLKQILPHLQYLKEKRNKTSMHKNENAKNYFTCFNPETKGLTFIDFTYTNYFDNKVAFDFEKHIPLGIIDVSSKDEISIGYIEEGHDYVENTTIEYLNEKLSQLIKENKLLLRLSFKSHISFQDYISVKEEILKTQWDHIQIIEDELIFN